MAASFTVESWIWYGFVVVMVTLRFTARLIHFKSLWRLQPEDWLMLFLMCLYTILIVFLNIDADVSTNLIDPADIPHLTPHDIHERTWGSKTVLLVEQCMCAVQWGTKVCLLLLYWRLTQNLTQNKVVIGVAIYVGVTYMVMEILYFGYWCRPFHDYWQTPTSNVQCTTALHHLILNMAFNLSSDFLIMSIPIPLLLKAQLELKRKIILLFPFSLGCFTIICAILSKHLTFTQPFSAVWVFWYCREASTAMIVSNMPYSWTLIRKVFKLKSFLRNSSQDDGDEVAGSGRGSSVSLQGLSVRQPSEVSTAARTKNRASWLFPGRKGGPSVNGGSRLQSHTAAPRPSQTWPDPRLSVDDKTKGAVHTSATAATSSSSNSVIKQPRTEDALDKLYPLEDLDDEVEKEMEREETSKSQV